MDVELLKAHSRAAFERLVDKPLLLLAPAVLSFVGVLLDTWVGARAWWLALAVGVFQGVAWGVWYAVAEEATGLRRLIIIAGLTLTLGVQAWNYGLGLLLLLFFCAVPVFELERRTLELFEKSGQLWLVSQTVQAVVLVMSWLVLSWLSSSLLGLIFGALLNAVLLAPVLTWWVFQRVEWCRD